MHGAYEQSLITRSASRHSRLAEASTALDPYTPTRVRLRVESDLSPLALDLSCGAGSGALISAQLRSGPGPAGRVPGGVRCPDPRDADLASRSTRSRTRLSSRGRQARGTRELLFQCRSGRALRRGAIAVGGGRRIEVAAPPSRIRRTRDGLYGSRVSRPALACRDVGCRVYCVRAVHTPPSGGSPAARPGG